MFRRKKYIQPRINTNEKSWSFAFYLSIVLILAISSLCALALYTSLEKLALKEHFTKNQDQYLAFSISFILSAFVFAGKKLASFKTLLHELKHAVVVVLSGNKMHELKVYKNIGHVGYSIYQKKIRFMPFILLAPYHLPLLSFPALAAAIVAEVYFKALWPFAALGACLSADLIIAYKDLHPHQSDIKRIFGGRFIAYTFVISANILWILICSIWLIDGNQGFINAADIAEKQITKIPEYFDLLLKLLRKF